MSFDRFAIASISFRLWHEVCDSAAAACSHLVVAFAASRAALGSTSQAMGDRFELPEGERSEEPDGFGLSGEEELDGTRLILSR
ncbi:MAG: hypothetical protein OXN84_04865 [Albidovulum sp.]|nr:hypothetical protein [Albidovulum sp.]